MLPLLKFYFHEEVRQAAVQAMPELLRSAFLAAEKGAPGADMGLVKRMLDFIWPPYGVAWATAGPPPPRPPPPPTAGRAAESTLSAEEAGRRLRG